MNMPLMLAGLKLAPVNVFKPEALAPADARRRSRYEKRVKLGTPQPACDICIAIRGKGPTLDGRGVCPREWAHGYLRAGVAK